MDIIYKDGSKAVEGDVIRWNMYDKVTEKEYTMIGVCQESLSQERYVSYIAGGFDEGLRMGEYLSYSDVLLEAGFNGTLYGGGRGLVEKIGDCSTLVEHIKAWGEDDNEC